MNDDMNETYVTISRELIIKRLSRLDLVFTDFVQKPKLTRKK